ncbi:hypothetical protein AB1E18_006638 [Capra hircus]
MFDCKISGYSEESYAFNGENWKLHKKIASNALQTFSKAEAKSSTCSCLLEEHVIEEVSELACLLLYMYQIILHDKIL